MVAVLVQNVSTYQTYQTQIPNGDSVPHPCKPNTYWGGVGHQRDQGAGERNQFGQDFEREGRLWTQTLCHLDSDGDGLTNGEELGDPDCLWNQGDTPSRLVGISNPGICDPWDSPSCFSNNITISSRYTNQEDWMRDICRPGDFVCPGINESGVQSLNLTINNGTQVPFMDKTYYCQIFDLGSQLNTSRDYHMIAVEPIIDNVQALHHVVLYGCEDPQAASPGPFDCGMYPSVSCQTFISIWTIGSAGDCFHSNTGISIGDVGLKKLAIQVFWNNPTSRDDWLDSSGVRIYYTDQRQYEIGIMKLGHESFLVPPNNPSVTFTSTCTTECTRKLLNASVTVTKAWNHMHYIGQKMTIQVIRNKTDVRYLTYDPVYNYDSPQVHILSPDQPFRLDPGDEVITTCTYNTNDQSWTTYWGESTTEEMCYGYLLYFPKENSQMTDCTTLGPNINYCDNGTFRGCTDLQMFSSPFYLNDAEFYQDILHNCHPYAPCVQECVDTLEELMKTDPCFQENLFDFIKEEMLNTNPVGQDMMARIASCQRQVDSLASNIVPSSTGQP
ncbi:DBH-like monooxygenase protein 1 [Bulinus truncatus]|nr:DBH-like monooxygenase protein 1 [Bulinus truncatus]